MKITYTEEVQAIINKPFYTAKDLSVLLSINEATARAVMKTDGFPLIQCGMEGGRKPRFRVEAVAFWRWARFPRCSMGLFTYRSHNPYLKFFHISRRFSWQRIYLISGSI